MPDYKEMYIHLMHETNLAIELLIQAQRDCEEMLLNAPEPRIVLLNQTADEEAPPNPTA